MQISLRHDIDKAIKYMSDVQKQQLPYATALALTRTAQDVQAEMIRVLPERFTLRTRWYKVGPYAFKITPAIKRNLQASVYTNAPFMALHEEGGTKIAHGGKKYLAIPTDNVRRNKRQLIPDNMRPAALLAGARGMVSRSKRAGHGRYVQMGKKVAFIAEIHGHLGIWMRFGSRQIMLMYLFRKEAEIHPRLFFEQTARKIVDKKFSSNFGRAMNEAVSKAR